MDYISCRLAARFRKELIKYGEGDIPVKELSEKPRKTKLRLIKANYLVYLQLTGNIN